MAQVALAGRGDYLPVCGILAGLRQICEDVGMKGSTRCVGHVRAGLHTPTAKLQRHERSDTTLSMHVV